MDIIIYHQNQEFDLTNNINFNYLHALITNLFVAFYDLIGIIFLYDHLQRFFMSSKSILFFIAMVIFVLVFINYFYYYHKVIFKIRCELQRLYL
jgi:hypothetical protein